MGRPKYKSIDEVPAAIMAAYRAGRYAMPVPPVCTRQWDDLAWINYIPWSAELYTGDRR